MVELIWEPRGVLRRFEGPVSLEELDRSAKQLQASERLDTLSYIIHDFSQATEVRAGPEDVEFLAVRASVALLRNPRVKIAFVGGQAVVSALIEAFNHKGISPLRCHSFSSLQDARRFVGS